MYNRFINHHYSSVGHRQVLSFLLLLICFIEGLPVKSPKGVVFFLTHSSIAQHIKKPYTLMLFANIQFVTVPQRGGNFSYTFQHRLAYKKALPLMLFANILLVTVSEGLKIDFNFRSIFVLVSILTFFYFILLIGDYLCFIKVFTLESRL